MVIGSHKHDEWGSVVKISSMLSKDFMQARPFLRGSAGSAGCAAAAAVQEILRAHARTISARPFSPYGPQGPFHLLGAVRVIK